MLRPTSLRNRPNYVVAGFSPRSLSHRVLLGQSRTRAEAQCHKVSRKRTVGAVYDRAYFVDSRKSARSQTAPTVPLFIRRQKLLNIGIAGFRLERSEERRVGK